MKTIKFLIPAFVLTLLLAGCSKGGGGFPDYDPPVWDDTVGIASALPGPGSVTVHWGTATDEVHPTVSYQVFMDFDDSPWNRDPLYVDTNDPITFSGLDPGQMYWFGVRAMDGGRYNTEFSGKAMAASMNPFQLTGRNTTKSSKMDKDTGGTLIAGYGPPNPSNIDENTKTISTTPSGPGNFWVRPCSGLEKDGKITSTACVADSSGFIYTAGYFNGKSNFYTESEFVSNGEKDSYLMKFDALGTHIWTRTWGGSTDDVPSDLAVDAFDQIYVVGASLELVGGDTYLMKLSPDGDLIWEKKWGCNTANSVCIDTYGNLFVAGGFSFTPDFDPGEGVENHTSNGFINAYMSKFDPDGNYLLSRAWGGSGDEYNPDEALAIDCDSSGDVYITGKFCSMVDFNPGPDVNEHTANGFNDVFLLKLDQNGAFQWSKTWGGADVDFANDLAVDASNNIYLTGSYSDSVNFAQGSGGEVVYTSNGVTDVFLSRFDSSGNHAWTRTWGGVNTDIGNRIETDINGNIFVLGEFMYSVDFDPGSSVNILTTNGGKHIFLSRFSPDGNFLKINSWGPEYGSDSSGNGLAVDGSSNIAVSGSFRGTIDFDDGPGICGHYSGLAESSFLMRLTPEY